jgi:hypothetical protein
LLLAVVLSGPEVTAAAAALSEGDGQLSGDDPVDVLFLSGSAPLIGSSWCFWELFG